MYKDKQFFHCTIFIGREEKMVVSDKHAANGNRTTPPFPENTKMAMFGKWCNTKKIKVQFCAKSEDNFKMSLLFHIKQPFFKNLFWGHFLSNFDKIFTTKQRIWNSSLVYLDIIYFVLFQNQLCKHKEKNNVTILLTYIVKSDIKISIFSLNHSFSKMNFRQLYPNKQ